MFTEVLQPYKLTSKCFILEISNINKYGKNSRLSRTKMKKGKLNVKMYNFHFISNLHALNKAVKFTGKTVGLN